MTFVAFLNELSYPDANLDEPALQQAIAGLVATLQALRKVQGSAALHSSVALANIPIGDDRWLGPYLSAGSLRDEWRYLRGFENRAPFRLGLGEAFGLDSEYQFEGERAEGLGLGHAVGTLAISFHAERWSGPLLSLDRIYLQADGEVDQDVVQVEHASTAAHITSHDDWLRRAPLGAMGDGNQLWETRQELFPHLWFLPRVEAQIRSLKAGEVRLSTAANALMDIEVAVSRWDTADGPLPPFLSHVSPEHQQRAEKFKFEDLDGVDRYFDLHSRFTPGAGRVHMWCDRAKQRAVIAHVGDKVPD